MRIAINVTRWAGLCVAATLFFGSGCMTGPDGESAPDIARISRVMGNAAMLGTQAWLLTHPGDRAYFVTAREALRALAAQQNYDPAAFAAALQGLPINELKGAEGSIYVSLFIVAWDELAAEATGLDQQIYIAPVLDKVIAGFDRALGP